MHRVLFIGGGLWQRAFVTYLKQQGCWIAVVNPVETVTTKLADMHIKLDINDLEPIKALLPTITPTIITSDQSDAAVPVVAKLCEHWCKYDPKIHFNQLETIERFTDKLAMCRFADKIGVQVPQTEIKCHFRDVRFFGEMVGYPIIIKPIDATMSRGFRKFNTSAEVTEEAVAATKQYTKRSHIIVQPFIPGVMVTLEGICLNGQHVTIATGHKESYYKPGINTGVHYPAHVQNTAGLQKAIELNDFFCRRAGLLFGLTHAEYILTEKSGPVMIETAARGGGAGITDKIIPWVTGENPYHILFAGLTGAHASVHDWQPRARPALLRYYEAADVKFGEQYRCALPMGVLDLQINFIGKQYIQDNYDTRHTMAIYGGTDAAGLEETVNQTEALLNPRVEDSAQPSVSVPITAHIPPAAPEASQDETPRTARKSA